jgi:signal transduction histidine kinase
LVPGSKAHEDGRVIDREISRLERIVTDFLQFARPTDPQLATLPADQPLAEVAALLGPQLAKEDIRLVLEDGSPLRIHADAGQIQQALINLVQNAADSIGRNGKIVLRARPGRKRLRNGETEVVLLEVADTGKGIPPEVQKRLFDPFFTTKENGTGLGLTIAARLVERNGGALQFQTQANRGSIFSIVLPKADA